MSISDSIKRVMDKEAENLANIRDPEKMYKGKDADGMVVRLGNGVLFVDEGVGYCPKCGSKLKASL